MNIINKIKSITNQVLLVCFVLFIPLTVISQSSNLSLQGIIDFTTPSFGNTGKAIHVKALQNIPDLSIYGIGVANNGGGSDGEEYNFDPISVLAGEDILVARDVSVMSSYFSYCFLEFDHVLQANTNISQNGDDAIELFMNGLVVETFGDVNIDGTGEPWEYLDSWAYKINSGTTGSFVLGDWSFGGINCTDGSNTIYDASCIYPICPLKTYVPDDNFENYLESNGMGDGIAFNDSVLTSNINTVTNLQLFFLSITDLTGIEDFMSLTNLNTEGNSNLTSVDISQNTLLVDARFNQCNLNSLDVSNNPLLSILTFGGNNVSSIDVSNNPLLTNLDCWNNSISTLDLSQNTALTSINCNANQISSLDFTNNPNMINISCNSNLLTTLDVTNLSLLQILWCPGNNISVLDLSQNSQLNTIRCENNTLHRLDVKNGNNTNVTQFFSTGNPSLECINVDDSTYSANNWTNIDSQQYFGESCYCTLNIDSQTNVSCYGGYDGALVLSGSGGSGFYNYALGFLNQFTGTLIPFTNTGTGFYALPISLTNVPANCYTAVMTDSLGCADTTNICVTQPDSIYSITTMTQCNQVIWNFNLYNSSGTYSSVLTAANGCDSTAILNVTLIYSDTSYTNVTACNSYTWNGATYTTSGSYFDISSGSNGCDSIAILNLIINSSDTLYSSLTSCDSLVWNGLTYFNSGIYSSTFSNINSCDSVVILDLTINNCSGCTDSLANNYNPFATLDDGTCLYSPFIFGCTDTSALNYNPLASIDDSSCCYNSGPIWNQIGIDIDGEGAGDYFGHSLSISSNGSKIAIGGYYNDGNGSNSGHVRVFENISGVWTQLGQDIDGESSGDGSSEVSLNDDGTIVVIGARNNTTNGSFAGHSRVFEYSSGNWNQIGQNIYGSLSSEQAFGKSVSINSIGNKVAIGSNDTPLNFGLVRVFQNISGSWNQIGQDIFGETQGDQSGRDIYLNSNGNILAIGSRFNDDNGTDAGHVRIYEYLSGVWTQIGQDIDGENPGDAASYSIMNGSIALSDDGSIIAMGALRNGDNGAYSGHVRVFENIGGIWSQIGQDIDGENIYDQSGQSISLSSNGNILAIGSFGANSYTGHVRIFKNISGNWTRIGQIIDGESLSDQCGQVSISNDGTIIGIGALFNSSSGHVRIYELDSLTTTPCNDLGCLDPLALNFDPYATIDDSSCVYPIYGCLDTFALNYSQPANIDDGSCLYCTNDTSYVNLTACDSVFWNGTTYTQTGTYTYSYTPTVGTFINGGYIFYIDSISDLAYIADSNFIGLSEWGCYGTTVFGADSTSIGYGFQNTIDIVNSLCITTNDAAMLSYNYSSSYSDWYLPSLDELELIRQNLFVPGYVNYNTGDVNNWFWSSTECATDPSGGAANVNFSGSSIGPVYCNNKNSSNGGVIPIREYQICDSTIILNLTINNSITSIVNNTACDSYDWDGVTYTTSGQYTNVYTGFNGCDSTVTLNLTINNSSSSTVTITACDSFNWDGVIYSTTGQYTNFYTALNGCDSAVILDLTVNQSDTSFITISACDSFTLNNVTYNQTGVYYQTVSADSIIGFNYAGSYNGSSYYISENTEYWSVAQSNSILAGGNLVCISDANENDFVSNILPGQQFWLGYTDETIEGSFVWVDGSSYTYTKWAPTEPSNSGPTGNEDYTLINSGEGGSNPFDGFWNDVDDNLNQYLYVMEIPNSHLTSNGCDSVIALNLTINVSDTSYTNTTSCDSVEWNGLWYNSSGTYYYNSGGVANTNSLSFDGNNDYIQIPDASVNNLSSGTIMTWVKLDDNTSETILCKQSDGENTYATLSVGSYANSSGHGSLGDPGRVYFHSKNFNPIGSSTNLVSNGVYTHVAVTFNQDSVSFYIDGQFSGTTLGNFSIPNDLTVTYTRLGFYNVQGSYNLDGKLDDVSIWSSMLSQAEIQDYINCSPLGNETNLVAFWNFNEGSGNTVYDQTSNGNDGTINGASYNTNVPIQSCTLTNSNGCDSVAVLNLTINNSSSSTVTITACDSFDWDGVTYTTTGQYTNVYTGLNGCDSTVTLDLTINNSSSSTVTITACDSYDWDGVTYTTTGQYTNVYTGFNGCDSTVVLDLTINNSSSSTVTITSCDSYDWDGVTYTTTGQYTNVYTALNGCDSTVTLDLTINNSSSSTVTITSCDSYVWDGVTYTTTGQYTNIYTGLNSCDSIVTLDLTIINSYFYSDTVTACDSYVFSFYNGLVYDSSGVYTDTLTTINGCDSIINLVLSINYSYSNIDTVSACSSYVWYGQTYFISGEYDTLFTNSNGCDSLFSLILTIVNNTSSQDTVETCDSYLWNGNTYYISGYYDSLFTNSAGCDSLAMLFLTVNQSDTSYTNITACDSVEWNGEWYDSSGTYYSNHSSINTNSLNFDGIDDYVTTSNNIFTNSEVQNGSVSCYVSLSDTLSDHHIFSLEGYVEIAMRKYNSPISSCLSKSSIVAVSDGSSICTGSGVLYSIDNISNINDWINITVTWENTNFIKMYVNGVLVSSNIPNISPNVDAENRPISFGVHSSFVFNSYLNGFIDNVHFWNRPLNIQEIQNYIQCSPTGSESDLIGLWKFEEGSGNLVIDQSINSNNGTIIGPIYSSNVTDDCQFFNLNGCDSVAVLDLTINNSSTSTVSVTSCDSFDWDNVTYDSTGIYTNIYSDLNGCDSTVTLDLTINNSSSSIVTINSCDSFDWDGVTYTTTGQYTNVYTGLNGCDSTVTLDLTINSSSTSLVVVSVCGFYIWDGVTYDSTGLYTNLYTALNGCDSTVTLDLTINNSSTSTVTIISCDTFDWDGITYDSTGFYTNIYADINGCDSTVNLDLTILYSSFSMFIVNACDSFIWDGIAYNTSGIYSNIYNAQNGCDSLVTLDLNINSPISNIDTNNICTGDSVIVGNSTYYISGNYLDTVVSTIGCDSIYFNTTVVILPSGCTDTIALNYDSLAQCEDYSCIMPIYGCLDTSAINYYSGANYDDGSCIYVGCTDSTANNFNPNATIDDGSCVYTLCLNPPPSGLYTNNITDHRVTINWMNMNSNDCMVWKYYVRYREIGTNTWITKSAGVGSGLCNVGLNTITKVLKNLTPSTSYEYKMKAFYCGGTESSYSQLSQFTTEDPCPVMSNLSTQTFYFNPSKVRFSWDTNGIYTFARIVYRIDTSGSSWQNVGGYGIYYPTLSINKYGLNAGQFYRAQGRTFCDSNITSYRSWWTPPIFWQQPSQIRLNGGDEISELDIYPNPSRDIFNISFNSKEVQDLEVRIISLLGKEIYKENLVQFVGEYTKSINLIEFEKSVYFLEIITDNGIINKKLILQ